MSTTIEREIKLRFGNPSEARAAILATGATLLKGRRLQEDCLLDTADGRLRHQHSILRVRIDSGKNLLTFKGPAQPSDMKVREETETLVGDGLVLLRILEELGYHVWFRYQKYREEFGHEDVIIALDETPVGTYVEIEGGERGIMDVTAALGRTPTDFLLDSYRSLYLKHCQSHDLKPGNMLFEDEAEQTVGSRQ
ncbi:MAG: class IV adenylate cyclase [Acidobacteria bacterium]|nr:class IV adenylate cyclase [Acidobacteriota bacterium]MBI3264198.1 class IV adenylate cyclase [Acidobacteriota bacterium]